MTITIYDTGTTYAIDDSAIYDPFPEPEAGEDESHETLRHIHAA